MQVPKSTRQFHHRSSARVGFQYPRVTRQVFQVEGEKHL